MSVLLWSRERGDLCVSAHESMDAALRAAVLVENTDEIVLHVERVESGRVVESLSERALWAAIVQKRDEMAEEWKRKQAERGPVKRATLSVSDPAGEWAYARSWDGPDCEKDAAEYIAWLGLPPDRIRLTVTNSDEQSP